MTGCNTTSRQLKMLKLIDYEKVYNAIIKLHDQIKLLKKAEQVFSEEIYALEIPKFIDTIKLLVEHKFKEYADRVEGNFKSIKLKEGEEGMRNLQQIQIEFGDFLTQASQENFTALERSKQKTLQAKIKKVIELEFDDYYRDSPKEFLEKLEETNQIRGEYIEDIEKIEEAIQTKLNKCIKDYQDEDNEYKRCELKINLENIMIFLSDKLAIPTKIKLEQAIRWKSHEQERYAIILDTAISNQDIDKISTLLKELNLNKLTKNQKEQVDKIRAYLTNECEKVEQSLRLQNILENVDNKMKASLHFLTLVEIFPSLYGIMTEQVRQIQEKWDQQLKDNLLVIVEHFSLKKALIQNLELQSNSMLSELEFDENGQVIQFHQVGNEEQNSIGVLLSISKFQQQKHFNKILPNFDKQINSLEKEILKSFKQVQAQFKDSIDNLMGTQLAYVLKQMKKWDRVVQAIINRFKDDPQSQAMQSDSLSMLASKLSEGDSYEYMISLVGSNIEELRAEFKKQKLLNPKTTNQEVQRNQFYNELKAKLLFLQQLNNVSLQNDPAKIFQEMIDTMKTQIKLMVTTAQDKIKLKQLGRTDYNEFNIAYNNILSIKNCIEYFAEQAESDLIAIKKQVKAKVQVYQAIVSQISPEKPQYEDVRTALICMKSLAINLPSLSDEIDSLIEMSLTTFKQKLNAQGITKLGILLAKEDIGRQILSDYKHFVGVSLSMFNTKIQRFTIDVIMSKLKGDGFDPYILKDNYDIVMRTYQNTLKENLQDPIDLSGLAMDIKQLNFNRTRNGKINFIKKEDHGSEYFNWDHSNVNSALKLIGYIFAYWTLMNSQHYFEAAGVDNQTTYLFQPHPAQVISVLVILGLSGKYNSLKKNLVEIKTGEGKSVTLAVTSTFLALLDFDVYCACYSQYLSQRDMKSFENLFSALGVDKSIKYGTFNSLSEEILNKDGNIRNMILDIVTNKPKRAKAPQPKDQRERILLIDEVDVFFSKEFFGNSYSPQASLRDPTINSLIQFIWSLRNQEFSPTLVKNSTQYQNCVQNPTFKGWEFLIEEAVNDMLNDLDDFESHDYIVRDFKIGYKQQDNIVFNAVYGFKTLFAYFKELEKGTVRQANLDHLMSIGINCGNFSYVEVFQNFKIIMGVTGTLEALSQMEKDVVKNDYKIKNWVLAPSAFGDNQLHKVQDIHIRDKEEYHNTIVKEITDRLVGKAEGVQRAVLVFFESKKLLDQFVAVTQLRTRFPDLLEITEKSTEKEKDSNIKRASSQGSVTVLTREFGRGTDFISTDDQVNANGGVHVIQTFLSEEFSEETQIKGRTARQGESGSYSMVLLESDLEKYGVKKEDVAANQAKIYAYLNSKRDLYFKNQYQTTFQMVQVAKEKHEVSLDIVNCIHNSKHPELKLLLKNLNKSMEYAQNRVRTVILMDATGSMSNLLKKAKQAVGTMFRRSAEILKEKRIPCNSYSIQFAAYRNYNSGPEELLQFSPFETKPEKLQNFMSSIESSGGWGDEAVEIGLWHVNQQNLKEPISQAILIGDAPANTSENVTYKRNHVSWGGFGSKQVWSGTPYAQATFYKDEMKKLANANPTKIPVHAFYVDEYAKECFEEIARETGGQCGFLDVNDARNGEKMLTDLVTGEILRMIGQKKGLGDDLIKAYQSKYAFRE